jgi:hypothetical protein
MLSERSKKEGRREEAMKGGRESGGREGGKKRGRKNEKEGGRGRLIWVTQD